MSWTVMPTPMMLCTSQALATQSSHTPPRAQAVGLP